MGIKYEAVFGDQGLFDRNDAPEDCEIIGDCCYKVICGEVNVWNFSEKRWCDHYKSSFLCLAMRRIIAEPKRWTVEDKKAGRLPEVGCRIEDKITGINTVLFNNGDYIVAVSDSHCAGKYIADNVFAYFNPIETPEEKAQREEDEFVKLMIDLASESQLMSCGFKDGVISAYRKLKGGE